MRGLLVAALLALSVGALSCSSADSGCSYDTDCPENQICLDGICTQLNPCAGISCPAGEVCVNGICVSQQPDGGQPDGHTNPCDLVNCPPGQVCENGICMDIGDCMTVNVSPVSQPPFECNSQTPCDSCALYQGSKYYCRSLNGGPHMFMNPDEHAPCDPMHACTTLQCAASSFYCLGAESRYLEGTVPTADPELCNGADDNCDGNIDEFADANCPPMEGATVQCLSGSCNYTCNLGYHLCGDVCKDNSSPDSCGTLCEPCPAPVNGIATCEYQQCGMECLDGSEPVNGQCLECNTDDRCGPECLPCDSDESCCDGECIDTTEDPLNCGGCGWSCGSSDYTCCEGMLCCAPESPDCCGNYCCDHDGYCCPGNYCCPAGGECCGEFCCPPPHTVCCPGGCCIDNSSCCNDFCCPDSHPVCCDNGCCPSGTYCCLFGNACCDKKSGLPSADMHFPVLGEMDGVNQIY